MQVCSVPFLVVVVVATPHLPETHPSHAAAACKNKYWKFSRLNFPFYYFSIELAEFSTYYVSMHHVPIWEFVSLRLIKERCYVSRRIHFLTESYPIMKYVTLPLLQPLCRILRKVRYTIVNCILDVFLISLSYTWTTEVLRNEHDRRIAYIRLHHLHSDSSFRNL